MKDRRKQWQKDCINFSWSKCGTIATERVGKKLMASVTKANALGRFNDMTQIQSDLFCLNINNMKPIETDEQYLDRIRQLLAA